MRAISAFDPYASLVLSELQAKLLTRRKQLLGKGKTGGDSTDWNRSFLKIVSDQKNECGAVVPDTCVLCAILYYGSSGADRRISLHCNAWDYHMEVALEYLSTGSRNSQW